VYENSRRSDSGFVTMANLVSQMKVAATEKGTILIPAFTEASGQPKKWKEIAPYVWRDVHGSERVAAKVVDGKVVRLSTDPYSPFMVFEPVPWWRSSGWLLPMVVGGMSALLLTVLAWPISALVRRRYKVRYELTGRDAKAHRLVRISALVVLAVIFGAIGLLVAMFSDYDNLAPKNDVFVHLFACSRRSCFRSAQSSACGTRSVCCGAAAAGRQSSGASCWPCRSSLSCGRAMRSA